MEEKDIIRVLADYIASNKSDFTSQGEVEELFKKYFSDNQQKSREHIIAVWESCFDILRNTPLESSKDTLKNFCNDIEKNCVEVDGVPCLTFESEDQITARTYEEFLQCLLHHIDSVSFSPEKLSGNKKWMIGKCIQELKKRSYYNKQTLQATEYLERGREVRNKASHPGGNDSLDTLRTYIRSFFVGTIIARNLEPFAAGICIKPVLKKKTKIKGHVNFKFIVNGEIIETGSSKIYTPLYRAIKKTAFGNEASIELTIQAVAGFASAEVKKPVKRGDFNVNIGEDEQFSTNLIWINLSETADKSTDKTTDKSTDKTTDKSTDKTTDKSTDKTTDKSTDKSADSSTDENPDEKKADDLVSFHIAAELDDHATGDILIKWNSGRNGGQEISHFQNGERKQVTIQLPKEEVGDDIRFVFSAKGYEEAIKVEKYNGIPTHQVRMTLRKKQTPPPPPPSETINFLIAAELQGHAAEDILIVWTSGTKQGRAVSRLQNGKREAVTIAFRKEALADNISFAFSAEGYESVTKVEPTDGSLTRQVMVTLRKKPSLPPPPPPTSEHKPSKEGWTQYLPKGKALYGWVLCAVLVAFVLFLAARSCNSSADAPSSAVADMQYPSLEGNSWLVVRMNDAEIPFGTTGAEVHATDGDGTRLRMVVLDNNANLQTVDITYDRATGSLSSPQLGIGRVEQDKKAFKIKMIFDGWLLEKGL